MDNEMNNGPLAVLSGEVPLQVEHSIAWRQVAAVCAAVLLSGVVAALMVRRAR